MSVKWIDHKGIPVLYSDYRLKSSAQIIETLHKVAEEVENSHEKVYKIVDFSNTPVNRKILSVGNKLGKEIFGKKTACSIFIGNSGLRRFYFNLYRETVSYPTFTANSLEEALEIVSIQYKANQYA
jgi:hypothetical protein